MSGYEDVVFTRSSVARILMCTPLTIRNRERSGVYPLPDRADNGYRLYTLLDVFELMWTTYNYLFFKTILAEMWSKGYKDPQVVNEILIDAKTKFYSLDPKREEKIIPKPVEVSDDK